MNPAAGAKQRVIELCRYRPADPKKAKRSTRIVSEKGATQTYKRKGDLVIVNPHAKSLRVTQNGWG